MCKLCGPGLYIFIREMSRNGGNVEVLKMLENVGNDNSVCKLPLDCVDRVYIFKETSPLPPTSHGLNLRKYNKQRINYHVITPNCLDPPVITKTKWLDSR